MAFGGNCTSGPIDVATARNAHPGGTGRLDFESETFLAYGFNARQNPDSWADRVGPLDTHGGTQAVALAMRVRRLMPEECEALQGFPRGYTGIPWRGKPAADGPRYRAIGNSWAVPVVAWIGARITKALHS